MFKSTVESQAVISAYHVLMKKREQVRANKSVSEAARATLLEKVDGEVQALGGIERYQQASMYGASTSENVQFNASLWVTTELKKKCGETQKLRVLDVGAIDDQYQSYKEWLDVTSIDINPQNPSVMRYDFFDFAVDYMTGCPSLPRGGGNGPYDAVVLSLVVNFVGCPRRRGDMAAMCAHPKLLKQGGLVFFVIPSACVNNSRYTNEATVKELMETLNFEQVSSKITNKLLLCVFRLKECKAWWDEERASGKVPNGEDTSLFDYGKEGYPRRLVRGGTSRNNFSMILRRGDAE
jgi:25S rRNA (adenine2142-N1)-methyltransferase